MQKHTPHPRHAGFTLIEMAIVLVVIGLILGMVFKGRQLIDQGRVKSLAAQYNKIIAAVNTYAERYGQYPGDGCQSATPASPMVCRPSQYGAAPGAVERNGGGAQEDSAFWYLLIQKTQILQEADRQSIFGQDWEIISHRELDQHWSGDPYPVGSYLNLPGGTQADPRIVCALDQLIDDGEDESGEIFLQTPNKYTKTTDCWTLSGQINAVMRILP